MPGPSLLSAGWEEAKPAEASIGKVNFIGIAPFVHSDPNPKHDDFKSEPRAIIQQYAVGPNGEMKTQTTAATYAELEQLAVENRNDTTNPKAAENLTTIQNAYKNLHWATKSEMNLGTPITVDDLNKLDKMKNPSLEELHALNKFEQKFEASQKAPVQLSYDHNGIY